MKPILSSHDSKKSLKKNTNQSFTFINMLMVIIITGFLPSVAMPLVVSDLNLNELPNRTKVAKLQSGTMQYMKLLTEKIKCTVLKRYISKEDIAVFC